MACHVKSFTTFPLIFTSPPLLSLSYPYHYLTFFRYLHHIFFYSNSLRYITSHHISSHLISPFSSLPFQCTLPGNYSDLVVIVLHKMIVSGLDKLSALYNCFLTIICNVSPYCKCLGTVAAVKILNLFQLFVSPRFLYATETNSVYVSLILETLNNIVQYQYEGNVNIVYAIVRR
jgi:Dyggve-Melchior-Clausen syndrome protein